MKSILSYVVIIQACLLSCKDKREVTNSGNGVESGPSALAQGNSGSLSTDILVPRKPLLPGIKSIASLNRIVTNKSGERISVWLSFDQNSSDTAIWEVPEVRRGWIRIQTDDGVIRIFQGRKLDVTRNDGVLHASGVPGWMIVLSTDTRGMAEGTVGAGLRLCNLDNVEPERSLTLKQSAFRMPMKIEKGVSHIFLLIEFSDDYKGDEGNWYVMQSV